MNTYIIVFCLGISGINYASEAPQSEVLKKLAAYKKIAQERKSLSRYAKSATRGAGGGAYGGASMGAGSLATTQLATRFMPGMSAAEQMQFAGGMLIGGILGGIAGGIAKEMFTNTSPEWIAQLEKLEKAAQDGKIDSTKFARIGGYPADIIAQNPSFKGIKDAEGKIYFLSQSFNDISSLNADNHYEIYLMPKDEYLVDIFLILFGASEWLQDLNFEKLSKEFDTFKNLFPYISFIGIRPTPGVSTSVYDGKYLPRIIIGLKEAVGQEAAHAFVQQLRKLFEEFIYAGGGIGYHPRYSEEIPGTNKFIYAAYGSGNYKDTAAGKQAYETMKNKSWWRFISRDIEDMAYKSEEQRISTKPYESQKESLEQKYSHLIKKSGALSK